MKKEVKIALVAICGLVILYFGMSYLKGMNPFSSATRYNIAFDDISGLATSSPIYADGYKVGIVKNIRFNYEHPGDIIVEADLDNDLSVPVGSRAEIESDMLGNVKVNLHLVHGSDEYVQPGGTIQGEMKGGALGSLGDMVPSIEDMIPKIDSILHSLNALLADPAIGNSLRNVEAITGDLAVTASRLNALLAEVNGQVPDMMRQANGILRDAGTLASNLGQVDVGATVASVNATLASVERFTAQLDNPEGSIGLLLHDRSLYENLSGTMESADSLLIDLRAHPKRYVHFSLFGRKDK